VGWKVDEVPEGKNWKIRTTRASIPAFVCKKELIDRSRGRAYIHFSKTHELQGRRKPQ